MQDVESFRVVSAHTTPKQFVRHNSQSWIIWNVAPCSGEPYDVLLSNEVHHPVSNGKFGFPFI